MEETELLTFQLTVPSGGMTTYTAILSVLPLLIANSRFAVLPACDISCGYGRTGLPVWHLEVLLNCRHLTGFIDHIAWTFPTDR